MKRLIRFSTPIVLGWTLYFDGQVIDTDVTVLPPGPTVICGALYTRPGPALGTQDPLYIKPGTMCRTTPDTIVVHTHKGIVYVHHQPSCARGPDRPRRPLKF